MNLLLAGVRTPFGKFGGALADYQAVQLGGIVIKELAQRQPSLFQQVDAAIMGMVLQAGTGQNPGRQAMIRGGLGWEIPGETINKVCASGLRSITLADQAIQSGKAMVMIAGGMESMSQAPYLATGMRFGQRMGHTQMMDSLLQDGLWCAFTDMHMIQQGNQLAKEQGITREAMDEWALRSHQRAVYASSHGFFTEEMISFPKQTISEIDESVRSQTTLEKLSALNPVYDKDGLVTAGNAPGMNDGACALMIVAPQMVEKLTLKDQALLIEHCQVAGRPEKFPLAPVWAIQKLLQRTGYTAEEIDLWEINEAFALVPLLAMKELDIPRERINVHGGAVAMGHPIGASGARIVLTLIGALRKRGGGLGIATICSGGGQGDAVLVKVTD